MPQASQTGSISAPSARMPRRKLSDQVVEQIKQWLMSAHMAPGDRLPRERELMRKFGVSKGTIRESLKALEVQGIISIKTGPAGGAAIARVSYETTAELLGN